MIKIALGAAGTLVGLALYRRLRRPKIRRSTEQVMADWQRNYQPGWSSWMQDARD